MKNKINMNNTKQMEYEIARLQKEVDDKDFEIYVFGKIVAELSFDSHCQIKEIELQAEEIEELKSALLESINIVIEK